MELKADATEWAQKYLDVVIFVPRHGPPALTGLETEFSIGTPYNLAVGYSWTATARNVAVIQASFPFKAYCTKNNNLGYGK